MPLATAGTVNVTPVSVHELITAAVVPNLTVPVAAPNPLPAMITFMPGWPSVGPIDPTSGLVVDAGVNCHTATVCAGSVKEVTGLFPPVPLETVMEDPPSKALR